MNNRIGKALAEKKRRARLQNHEFSIIANNCMGGVVSNSLGEQFRSPTVNVLMSEYQFIAFCKYIKEYSKCPVDELTKEEWEQFRDVTHPVGVLRGYKIPNGHMPDIKLPDIMLLFVHYRTFTEAKEKWEERFKRVNYDDLYIVMDCAMNGSDEILDEFNALPQAHKVAFTHKEDPERWPGNYRFSFYTEEAFSSGCVYNPVNKGLVEYKWMDEFDFIAWLNEGKIQKNPDFE